MTKREIGSIRKRDGLGRIAIELNKTIKELQKVLDDWLITYSNKRPHQDRGMNGSAPIQASRDGLKMTPKPDSGEDKKEEKMPPKQAA